MFPFQRPRLPGLTLACLLALAACDSAEERAETHYQRGMALLAEGDAERASLEFRNVFRLDPDHGPARLEFARLLRARGDRRGALGQYLRVVDRDRDSLEGHRAVAELALEAGDIDAAAAHVGRAFALAPEDPAVRALKATMDFRAGEHAAAVAMAEAVLAATPDSVPAHMVVIAEAMRTGDFAAARARSDAALAAVPGDEGLHLARLATLEQLGDTAAVGAALKQIAARFPDNEGAPRALVRWHLQTGDPDGAEAVLRGIAARSDAVEPRLEVVRFLAGTEGPAAARVELERLIAARPDPRPYRRALAGLDFAEGDPEAAIAGLRGLLDGAEASDETRDIRIDLAGMLDATGDAEGRDALVAAVLEADPGHVAALKLRARALIDGDQPDAAVRDLRRALGDAPRDPEIMTLMARAHERAGNRELMGERLALAVELSDGGPAESIRYARFLMQDGREGPAEAVVVDALRRAPDDEGLLAALGRIHLERRDFHRVAQVADLLRGQPGPAAAAAAAELDMARLEAEGRTEEAVAMLEALAASRPGLGPRIALVRSLIAAGDLAAAEARVEALRAETPGDPAVRMLQAGLHVLAGETAEAEALYRAVAAERPEAPEAHRALAALLAARGREAEAIEVLDAGLAATGRAPALLFAQAGLLEAAGDFEGAIARYEELYARDSGDPVVANNLASLISTHRDGAEELDRAFRVARRLRGTDVPQFQDTYGWILARRGDPGQGLAYLEPAAAALGADPLVQFHLGMAYFALERWPEARAALARAVAAAAERPLPQIAEARARIAAIDARPDPGADTGSEG